MWPYLCGYHNNNYYAYHHGKYCNYGNYSVHRQLRGHNPLVTTVVTIVTRSKYSTPDRIRSSVHTYSTYQAAHPHLLQLVTIFTLQNI